MKLSIFKMLRITTLMSLAAALAPLHGSEASTAPVQPSSTLTQRFITGEQLKKVDTGLYTQPAFFLSGINNDNNEIPEISISLKGSRETEENEQLNKLVPSFSEFYKNHMNYIVKKLIEIDKAQEQELYGVRGWARKPGKLFSWARGLLGSTPPNWLSFSQDAKGKPLTPTEAEYGKIQVIFSPIHQALLAQAKSGIGKGEKPQQYTFDKHTIALVTEHELQVDGLPVYQGFEPVKVFSITETTVLNPSRSIGAHRLYAGNKKLAQTHHIFVGKVEDGEAKIDHLYSANTSLVDITEVSKWKAAGWTVAAVLALGVIELKTEGGVTRQGTKAMKTVLEVASRSPLKYGASLGGWLTRTSAGFLNAIADYTKRQNVRFEGIQKTVEQLK